MRALVLLALIGIALAVPFKTENEEPKSDIVTQKLVPNLEEDKDLVNAVNLLQETEKELEDSEVAKKSPTTVCVEVQPKNPYEKPYTVCEPVNHSHGPVVQPASTYGAGAGASAGAGAAAGYKPTGAGYQAPASSGAFKGPVSAAYQQGVGGSGYAGPQQVQGTQYGANVPVSHAQYGPGVAAQLSGGQYGAPGAGSQYASALTQTGHQGVSTGQYGAAAGQYGSGAASSQYGVPAGAQYGPGPHSEDSQFQSVPYGQAPAHFSAPSPYAQGYGHFGSVGIHAGPTHFAPSGYREADGNNNAEDQTNTAEESLGSVHKVLHKKKGGTHGGTHNSGYRTAEVAYGPTPVIPSFVVANQVAAGYKPTQHYTQASTYTQGSPAYSIPAPAAYSTLPAPAYSSLAYQTPAIPSYSVASAAYGASAAAFPAASTAFSVPSAAYSLPPATYAAPAAAAYPAIQTLPALPSYSIASAPATYQAAAVQSQAYTAPAQAQAYSAPATVQPSSAAYTQVAQAVSPVSPAVSPVYSQPQTYTTYTAQPPCPTNYLFSCAPSIRPVPCSQSFQPQTVQVTPIAQQQGAVQVQPQVAGLPTYQPTYGPGKVSIYRDAEEGQTNQPETDQTKERSNPEGLPVQPKSTLSNIEQIKQDQMAMDTIARMNELASQNQKGQKKLTDEQNSSSNNGNNNTEDKKVGSEATSADGQGITKSSS